MQQRIFTGVNNSALEILGLYTHEIVVDNVKIPIKFHIVKDCAMTYDC